jgi:hypothetical protein
LIWQLTRRDFSDFELVIKRDTRELGDDFDFSGSILLMEQQCIDPPGTRQWKFRARTNKANNNVR